MRYIFPARRRRSISGLIRLRAADGDDDVAAVGQLCLIAQSVSVGRPFELASEITHRVCERLKPAGSTFGCSPSGVKRFASLLRTSKEKEITYRPLSGAFSTGFFNTLLIC